MFAEILRRRIVLISLLLATLALIFITLPVAQVDSSGRQPLRRIKFKSGETSARVRGRLRGQNDVARYIIRVRAGQQMRVNVESEQLGNPQIDVIFPSGKQMDKDMQGTQFNTDSTEAGDYRINVYEGRKADPSDGIFYLNVKVL
jgi:hypothetical protein